MPYATASAAHGDHLIVFAALDTGLRNWRMRQKSKAALQNSNRRAKLRAIADL
jgi:hypothetical protein